MSLLGQHKPVKLHGKRYCAICGVAWPCRIKQEEIINRVRMGKS